MSSTGRGKERVPKVGDVATGPGWELRCGDYREVLADVERVDAVLPDPPYGHRTHSGQRTGGKDPRYARLPNRRGTHALASRGLPYASWSPDDVAEFVTAWIERTAGWFVSFTSHDLIGAYSESLQAAGRYVFAPVPCIQLHQNVRLAGDGPANWATYLVPGRPRWARPWGALRGAYVGPSHDKGENALDRSKRAVPGGKPLWLMRAIVRDYSRPGDLVCDPCAGGGTTLLAAVTEGRRAIGAEPDPETFEKAVRRLQAGYTPTLFNTIPKTTSAPVQVDLVTEATKER